MMAGKTLQKENYTDMEGVLKYVNGKIIALSNKEIKRNNVILNLIIDKLIHKMKQKNQLFKSLFRGKFYGGSYYDGLKVGNPNEYDLDLIFSLPVISNSLVHCSDQPAFVHIEIKDYWKILKRPTKEKSKFIKLNSLFDKSNYLSANKVLRWMEQVLNKAINELNQDERNSRYIDIFIDRQQNLRIYLNVHKGAPAFTLTLSGKNVNDYGTNSTNIEIDVDIVPCFRFDNKNWPDHSEGYRENPSKTKLTFLVVPKTPKESELVVSTNIHRYWRLSFQEQERELMTKYDNMRAFKPCLKLMKKLRDKHNHKVASYFIKTVFLWSIHNEPETFWNASLSFVFMSMLKKYEECLSTNNIPYYWNSDYNLIKYLKNSTKIDIANTLKKIIFNIERSLIDPIDPYCIGKFLVSSEEYDQMKNDVRLTSKQKKALENYYSNNLFKNSPNKY